MKRHPVIEQLEWARKAQGLSHEQLAKSVGYDVDSVIAWSNLKDVPNFFAICDIAQVLGYELVLRPKRRERTTISLHSIHQPRDLACSLPKLSAVTKVRGKKGLLRNWSIELLKF